jgi:hypothetical protein
MGLAGCAKPDKVENFFFPNHDMAYTVKYHDAAGPADSDFARVYVHPVGDEGDDSQLVIDGDYLTFSKVRWKGPREAVFCLSSGMTNTYRNQVTLRFKKGPQTVKTHLLEGCSDLAVPPNK